MKQRVRVKICGLTRLQDVSAAVAAGADAVGLVFYPPSPRYVDAAQAQQLLHAVPPYVQVVGLFVNPELADLQQIVQHVPIDIVQFHGDETPEQCHDLAQQLQRRWYKAIQVKADIDVADLIRQYRQAGASAVLLDAWHPELKGGTGHCFDWSQFPQTDIPLILAGGLTPDNVAQAIAQTRPYAVDVSGGVEVSKGIKDYQLIQQFMQGVQRGSAV